jgi:hypothetical protein
MTRGLEKLLLRTMRPSTTREHPPLNKIRSRRASTVRRSISPRLISNRVQTKALAERRTSARRALSIDTVRDGQSETGQRSNRQWAGQRRDRLVDSAVPMTAVPIDSCGLEGMQISDMCFGRARAKVRTRTLSISIGYLPARRTLVSILAGTDCNEQRHVFRRNVGRTSRRTRAAS